MRLDVCRQSNGINGIGHHFAADQFYQLRNLYAKACFPSHHHGISFGCVERTRSGIKSMYSALAPCMRNKQGARQSHTHTHTYRWRERGSARDLLSHPTSYFVQQAKYKIPIRLLFDGRPYGVLFVNTVHGYV